MLLCSKRIKQKKVTRHGEEVVSPGMNSGLWILGGCTQPAMVTPCHLRGRKTVAISNEKGRW